MNNSNNFNPSLIWDKIKENAKRLGRGTTRLVLLMYYVLKSESTPRADKILVYSALAYLVLPINLISIKRHPLLGGLDEIASIALAYNKIKNNITPAMEQEVDAILDKWFGDYTDYEIVE